MDAYSIRLFCQFLTFPYFAALLCGFYFAFVEIKKDHAKHKHFVPIKAQAMKSFLLLNIGGAIYVLIELLYRGYSHWTMYLVGGLCFIQLGLINEVLPWTTSIEAQALLGTVIATVNELVSGLIINKGLGYQVWDYSNQPFNLFGQICLQFTFYWIFIALFAIVVDDCLKYYWWKEPRPMYYSCAFGKIFELPIPKRKSPGICDCH